LEGCYTRAGLLSDAELYEELPARYSADVARRRRWIRGDWQLVGWLRRNVQRSDGHRERNPLSMLSQWKIFDNLRRSLVPAALALLLLIGWSVLAAAWFWTAVVIVILVAPAVIASLSDLVDKPADVPFRQHLAAVERAARRLIAQAVLSLAFLPYEAFFCLDAIVRTIWRILITRRSLLEWNTSSEVDRALERVDRTDLFASYRSMAVAPAIAVAAWIGLSFTNPAGLAVAGPILLLGFDNDPNVPHASLVAFEQAQQSTNPVDSHYYSGTSHVTILSPDTADDATARIVAFLAQHLG
jgi:hypothetical protein